MIHNLALLITLVVLWLGPAILVAKLAQSRGRDFATFMVISLVVPWPLMILVVLGLPKRESPSASSDS